MSDAERAKRLHDAARRAHRQADRIQAAIDHPSLHPPIRPGTVTAMPTFDHLLAAYAHTPDIGRRDIERLRAAATAWEHTARQLTALRERPRSPGDGRTPVPPTRPPDPTIETVTTSHSPRAEETP